jgi:hypothetical protein
VWRVIVLVAAVLPLGCGGDSDNEREPGGNAGTGMLARGGSGGAPIGGGGGGATAGVSNAGNGGAGGNPTTDCSGSFGTPSVVLSVPGLEIGSLAPSSNELELIYQAATQAETYTSHFYRSVRASKDVPFAPGTPLPELDAACADVTLGRSGDLSADGLTFYFVCYRFDTEPDPMAELHVARRPSPSAAFVVDAMTYGTVRPGPSISTDELTLYTSSNFLDTMGVNTHVRTSTSTAFGSAAFLSALERVITPDVSSNGLFLFGSLTGGEGPSALVVSTRASTSDMFAPHTPLLTAPDQTNIFGSPAISSDCRSLYYVSVNASSMPSIYTAMVVKR